MILDAKEELHDRIEHLEDEIELLARSAQDMAALQHGARSSGGSKAKKAPSKGQSEDEVSALPSMPALPSFNSFTRRRAESSMPMPSPRGGGLEPVGEERVVASTRTSFAVGAGGGGGAGIMPGGSMGGSPAAAPPQARARQESKSFWPFAKEKK